MELRERLIARNYNPGMVDSALEKSRKIPRGRALKKVERKKKTSRPVTAAQLVLNPFSQFFPQLELYSQLQLSLWSDPIACSVPKSTWRLLVKIQGDGNLAETQIKK